MASLATIMESGRDFASEGSWGARQTDTSARRGRGRARAGGGQRNTNKVTPILENGGMPRGADTRGIQVVGSTSGGGSGSERTFRTTKNKSPGGGGGTSSSSSSRGDVKFVYRTSSFMVDPRDPFMRKWDVCSILLLIFAALVTPYEVAFLSVQSFSPLWWINRVIDVFFFCDLVMNFNLIYFDEKKQGYVSDRRRVVRRYLRGFFLIDLVSITPFKELSSLGGGGGGENFKLIRIVRIVRLAKLLRILRSSSIFQRFENQLTVSYGLVRLYKFLIMVLVLCHWLACMWNLVRRMEASRCNWAANYFTESACLDDVDDPIDATPLQLYIVSFYLAVMTTSTVGYGDVTPVTDGERMCLVFSMLVGASVFAYVVGNICDIVATLNQRESEFQEMMDSVNRFIKDGNLSKDLASQIRAFFRYRRNATDMSRYVQIINTLSPQMRGAVALELNSQWMQSVELFDGCPENLLIEVTFVVKPRSYPPLEEFISTKHMTNSMFIIRRGLVASKGRVKGAGSVFGDDVILANIPYTYKATTLTFVDISILDRSDLEIILESFPDSKQMLLRRAKRASICERMIRFAKAVRAMERVLVLEDAAAAAAAAKKEQRKKKKKSDKKSKMGGDHDDVLLAALPPLDRPTPDLLLGVGDEDDAEDSGGEEDEDDEKEEEDEQGDEDADDDDGDDDDDDTNAAAAAAAADDDEVEGGGGGGGNDKVSLSSPEGLKRKGAAASRPRSKSRVQRGKKSPPSGGPGVHGVSVAVPFKMSRDFFDFDSQEDILLPYGGMINVMMFADNRYREQMEESATKIQAMMRGAITRRRIKREYDSKMSDIREQIADEKFALRLKTKVLMEDGLVSAEQAATMFSRPPPTGASSSSFDAWAITGGAGIAGAGIAGAGAGGAEEHRRRALLPSPAKSALTMPPPSLVGPLAAPAISVDLARNIRETAAKVDKFGARMDKIAEDQKVIFAKIAEIYKVVLRSNR